MRRWKEEKTYVEDVDRGIYDIKNVFTYDYKADKGLNAEIVEAISKEKNEPQWMTDFRLKSLEIYNSMPMPAWGPDLSDLNMDEIITYIRPNTDMKHSWDDVPEEIKMTFELLGIPQAERKPWQGLEPSMIRKWFTTTSGGTGRSGSDLHGHGNCPGGI